jgi:alanyl-tRNA synthetase
MGFERVSGIHATTRGFRDFSAEPSNYDSEVFRPLFARISELSGRSYKGTVPKGRTGLGAQEHTDVAFRVLADHARCVCCAISDGILPGNEGRNYVIRRILRRAALYGRNLGLSTGFFEKLVEPVVASLGGVFPELRRQEPTMKRVIRSEEESFGRTLERGLKRFEEAAAQGSLPGTVVFELYDTYGFPVDLTQVLAAERGLAVDSAGFEALMEQQRQRGRSALKKEVIVAATEGAGGPSAPATVFTGYAIDPTKGTHATVVDVARSEHGVFVVFDRTPFYAEMGGQVGDSGRALIAGAAVEIVDTVRDKAGRPLHRLAQGSAAPAAGAAAELQVDYPRRRAIQRNHTATHLLHWALRKVLGTHVRQAGSLNAPDRLRFDFSHFEAVTHAQLREIEELVNQRVLENARVEAYEVDFDRRPEGTLAFFGDKYGKVVRVVDIGGYSRELCAGTHVATTGEVGLVRIVHEGAIAAGTRRIEAAAGEGALRLALRAFDTVDFVAKRLGTSADSVERQLGAWVAAHEAARHELDGYRQKEAGGRADLLVRGAEARGALRIVKATVEVPDTDALRSMGSQVLSRLGEGVVVLASSIEGKAAVAAFCSAGAIAAGHDAGAIVREISQKLGGRGGGKPDFAMGGGRDVARLAEALGGALPKG